MKLCHVCNFECNDDAELCPICGADLTVEGDKDENEEILLKEPVLLASLEDVVSAEILEDILTTNKIPYSTSESEENAMRVVFGGGFSAVEIYVDSSDFETAEKLYNEFLENEPQFEGEFFFEDEEEI